eukprot:Plantae.Rhodophyta-Hildenbrandia_rubra.ctg3234.p1 GENE.Plantae.Rhodophyta-Hildenbrandia_rubra.ctg3234~~Plantae.Rhodophyta-Hildenbrandia_rubra.ctg3234.p1  ORF type:complete len:277 (-),score=48.71 Plantae.Rhodophyta-Hildenbrandia_rubra.ctg3234:2669-3451(-)
MQQTPQSFTTGSKQIDDHLSGGISITGPGSILEISGIAGSGKTQLAMQMSLSVALPLNKNGLDCCSVLIITEGEFLKKRFFEIESGLMARCGLQGDDGGTKGLLAGKVIVEKVDSVEGLISLVEYKLPFIMRKSGAKVVIIDSVAAVFRPEFDSARSRASYILKMVEQLRKTLMEVGGIAVCVNQVSQRFDSCSITGTDLVPALGSVWASCVGMRVYLERVGDRAGCRSLRVLNAPHIAPTERLPIVITSDGVIGENELE